MFGNRICTKRSTAARRPPRRRHIREQGHGKGTRSRRLLLKLRIQGQDAGDTLHRRLCTLPQSRLIVRSRRRHRVLPEGIQAALLRQHGTQL